MWDEDECAEFVDAIEILEVERFMLLQPQQLHEFFVDYSYSVDGGPAIPVRG